MFSRTFQYNFNGSFKLILIFDEKILFDGAYTYALRLLTYSQSVSFIPLNDGDVALSMCIRNGLDAIRQIDRSVREPENYAASISRDAILATIILHESQ